jgi:LPXTG-motif cell wall-anchored protein
MKKLFALVLALTLILGLATTAFATDVEPGGDNNDPAPASNGTITITLPTEKVAPSGPVTYEIYKVFEAVPGENGAVSYRLVSGKTAPLTAGDGLSKFDVDAAGNVLYYTRANTEAEWVENKNANATLSASMIDAIAEYIKNDQPTATVTSTVGDTTVTASVPYGYYYISTSTGTAVSVDSTTPNASVQDKNVLSVVVKSAGSEYDEDAKKAIAAVGTDQPFTAVITKGKGAVNVVFTDSMTNMIYNGDVKVYVNDAEVAASATINTDADNETWKVTAGEQGSDSFSITFDDDYIAHLADNTTITIKYSGKITSDALSVNPATNTATLTTGEGSGYTSETPPVQVYNAKFTVNKKDGNNQPLAGAGFVIKNAEGKFYKLHPATDAVEDDPDTEEVETAPAADAYIEWVDSIDDADEHFSDAQGAVAPFTGLGVGTYTLVEKTTPAGYNTAADYDFEIVDGDYSTTNLEQGTNVVNESGVELPSTGGIGTTIFYVVGGLLAAAAVVLLITKKRMSKEN